MRILHTSDWHLGRAFHGASLLDEQAEMVDRVVSLAAEHQVELVVIAGDLFDRAIPPAPAVDLLDDALARLHATGAHVAAISGNHDSAVRVGINDRLLNGMGVAVRGQVARIHEPLVIEHPADGGSPVAVYLVPYLEPAVDVAVLEAGLGVDELADDASDATDETDQTRPRARPNQDLAMRLATERIRRHLAGQARSTRSIVVAHGFVAGGSVSDSERDLSVGGSERVAVDVFDGFDLVTLGHLHQPQEMAGPRIAYSGSPMPYSFSEEGQVKSVRLVDLASDGVVTAEVIPLHVGRPVITLTGTLVRLLGDPGLDHVADARIRALLTDPHLPNQAMAQLRQRFPHAVELRHQPEGVDPAVRHAVASLATIEDATPLDLALQFWTEQQGADATANERSVLHAALAATALAGDAP